MKGGKAGVLEATGCTVSIAAGTDGVTALIFGIGAFVVLAFISVNEWQKKEARRSARAPPPPPSTSLPSRPTATDPKESPSTQMLPLGRSDLPNADYI